MRAARATKTLGGNGLHHGRAAGARELGALPGRQPSKPGPRGMASSPKVQLPAVPADAPAYWAQACQHLVKKDRVMRRLIPQMGSAILLRAAIRLSPLRVPLLGNQVSVKDAAALWKRAGSLRRGASGAGVEGGTGLSSRKVDYLLDLSTHFIEGRLRPIRWPEMDDEAIITRLTAIRGVGRWTAQMCLVFIWLGCAGMRGDQGHQQMLFLGRPGQPQRCP